MEVRPMTILLIEDDEFECKKIKAYTEETNSAKIVAVTDSSDKGIELYKMHSPQAIILDIELHKGQGSGIEFLEKLKEIRIESKPIIVVTTNAASSVLYDKLHQSGVDLIFYKKQSDYSAKLVISAITSLGKVLYNSNRNSFSSEVHIETQAEMEEKISNRINTELDLIGIGAHLKGREYIHDAIKYIIQNENSKDNESVFNYLGSIYKKTTSSIGRVIQTAINYAWRTSATEDLETHYTAKINYYTGVPTPTEFIYYYARKIKKVI